MNDIYKYSKLLRKTDEGVMALFNDIVVINEECVASKVPCIWSNHERTKAYIEQNDKVKLPLISIYSNNITMPGSTPVVHYNVKINTLFQEDMNQILEQILLKFDNKKNCKLLTVARNFDDGDLQIRVLKSALCITVEGIGVPVETHE